MGRKPATKKKATDTQGDYELYLDRVPVEARDALAREVESIDLGNYRDVAQMGRRLLAALVRGHLPPGVSQEARSLLELELLSLAAEDRKESGQLGGGGALLIEVMQDARARQEDVKSIEPRYTIDVTPAKQTG